MTDTGPPTQVDDVVVTGQRRKDPTEAFPERPQIIVWEGTFDEIPADLEEPPPDPCADPVTRRAWNADAAAAQAAEDIFGLPASLNDGSTLANREFGTNLLVSPNGSVARPSVPISVGAPATQGFIPNVYIDNTGRTDENWMGDIHNHPSGDGRLSDNEWTAFVNTMSQLSATTQRTDLALVSVYVVVLDSTAPKGYRIYAYTRDTPYGELGEEVNPNAQPCS